MRDGTMAAFLHHGLLVSGTTQRNAAMGNPAGGALGENHVLSLLASGNSRISAQKQQSSWRWQIRAEFMPNNI